MEETGLRPRVELTRSVVPTLDPEHAIYLVNPLGQIPTLVLDDGKVLHDSLVIQFYLDDVVRRRKRSAATRCQASGSTRCGAMPWATA